ncbi:MAG: transcriptional repressor [Faecalibacterium prausnitzii]|uniref:Transcriptional repressor n=1 Tax=Faecalibacterium prausnitzii TaxID=853 RepID=A0A943FW33_9FIRM|nr:transcriptional repressor [Faecalibacterium prausnitzii]
MPKYAEEILAVVTELQRHLTAEQVFMEMKKEHPSIAIGTVYKHRTERHDHLICSRCGKIADVHLPDIQSRIEYALGCDILSYDLKIRYICPDCREQEENNAEGGTQ